MSQSELFPVSREWMARAWVDAEHYEAMYRRSIEDPEGFWGEQGRRLDWIKPYTRVKDVSFASKDLHIRWYYDGTLNACYNCVDRHLAERADRRHWDLFTGPARPAYGRGDQPAELALLAKFSVGG